MVNVSINETTIKNSLLEKTGDIFSAIGNKISNLSATILQKLSEYGSKPTPLLGKILALFLGGLAIYGGLKVGQKALKVILWILGILIIISVIWSFFW